MSGTKTDDILPDNESPIPQHLNLELPLQGAHPSTLFHSYLFLCHKRYLDYLVMSNFLYPLRLHHPSFLPSLYHRFRMSNSEPLLSENFGSAGLRKSGRAFPADRASVGEDCDALMGDPRMIFEGG